MVCRIWDDISEQYVDSNLLLGNPAHDFEGKKREWLAKFNRFSSDNIDFFDSSTHPLTLPSLRI